MIRKIFKYLIPIVILVSILFSGINVLNISETLLGVRQAVHGAEGTSIYASHNLYVFLFPKGENLAFTGIARYNGFSQFVRTICNANCVDFNTATDFKSWIESPASGFTKISPKDLPPGLVSTVMSLKVILLTVGTNTFPTMFAIPIGILNKSMYEPIQVIQ